MHKHDFGVSEFVEEIGISRSSLHSKLKLLTELSSSQFLMVLRLKKAADLIKSGDRTIAEVSA